MTRWRFVASGRFGLAALVLALTGIGTAYAQGTTAKPQPDRASRTGMVITGDREGPLGTFVAPWQEPPALVPDALRPGQLPIVLDSERTLAEDPVNRAVPAIAAVKATPAQAPKEAQKTGRRGRGQRDEPVRPTIMQHDKQ
jgi:hypothetical protein